MRSPIHCIASHRKAYLYNRLRLGVVGCNTVLERLFVVVAASRGFAAFQTAVNQHLIRRVEEQHKVAIPVKLQHQKH
jgi:hypothetical protein